MKHLETEWDWARYYELSAGRSPRPLLHCALALRGQENPGDAIDLGSGDGVETLFLLEAGWRVLAIDQLQEAIDHLRSRVPDHLADALFAASMTFRQMSWPRADLVWAGHSLSFCDEVEFQSTFEGLSDSLTDGGIFAGHLLGDRDSWRADGPPITAFVEEDLRRLLERDFRIEVLFEREEDGFGFGTPKHWHFFEVIARRANPW